MTDDDWQARTARRVARQVKHYREKRGMSAQQLADACTALGLPLKRSVVANFESGRRATVSVPELMVLATVLEVPPLMLIFPVGIDAKTEVPGGLEQTWDAAKWFTGEDGAGWDSEGWQLLPYRKHEHLVAEWRKWTEREQFSDGHTAFVELAANQAWECVRQIKSVRRLLREAGALLPDLPPELRHVEEEAGADQ